MSRIGNLASDTLIYGVFTIVGRFLTFLLTPVYTNYLSVDDFADIGFIFATLAFINIIYSFGMDSAFFRFYAEGDKYDSRKVFSNAYLSIAIVSFVSSLTIYLLSDRIAAAIIISPKGPELVKMAAAIPFLDALLIAPYSYLRITRQARKFALTKFALVVIAVSLNILFVVSLKMGAEGVMLAQVSANLAGAVLFIPMAAKNIVAGFDFPLLRQMLRYGLPTMPAALSGMILQVGDRWILRPMVTPLEFNIYQTNYKLGIPMALFVAMYEYAWKPFYLTRFKDKDAKELFARTFTYFTIAASLIFLTTSLFMEYVVRAPFLGGRFINPKYWGGMGIIPVVLAAYYFNGAFNNFACGFHIQKRTELLPIAVTASAALNVGMNFALIPTIGYWGAAWATLAAYAAEAVILYKLSRKVYPIRYRWRKIGSILAAAAATYALGSSFSPEKSFYGALIFRIALLGGYLFALKALGLFGREELEGIKNMFKRNKAAEL